MGELQVGKFFLIIRFQNREIREFFRRINWKTFSRIRENFSFCISKITKFCRSVFPKPEYFLENREIFGNAGDAGEKPGNAKDLVEIFERRRAIVGMRE